MLQGRIFGDTFPLAAAGADGLAPDALVPGIAVFSRRAEALAAWTSGVQLASVSADTDRACLILETGVNDRFRCRSGNLVILPHSGCEGSHTKSFVVVEMAVGKPALVQCNQSQQCIGHRCKACGLLQVRPLQAHAGNDS